MPTCGGERDQARAVLAASAKAPQRGSMSQLLISSAAATTELRRTASTSRRTTPSIARAVCGSCPEPVAITTRAVWRVSNNRHTHQRTSAHVYGRCEAGQTE